MTVSLIQTALELGLFGALTVLALYLSYTMLNVCDLSTDGCFTMGATVGAVVAISGHPFLSIPAAMAAGMASGFIVALLQTRMGIDSLLSGIIVNTAWYSVNIAVMGNASLLNMNKTDTVFTRLKDALGETVISDSYRLLIALAAVVLVVAFLSFFLKTRLGLAIRATGDNPDMVRSSSGVYDHSGAVYRQCLHCPERMPDGTVSKVGQYRHRIRNGDHSTGFPPHREGDRKKRRYH